MAARLRKRVEQMQYLLKNMLYMHRILPETTICNTLRMCHTTVQLLYTLPLYPCCCQHGPSEVVQMLAGADMSLILHQGWPGSNKGLRNP